MSRRVWLVPVGLIAIVAALLATLVLANNLTTVHGSTFTLPVPPVPAGKHVIYLIAENAVAQDSLIAPTRIEATLRAQIANTWEELVAINQSTPADAIIIHNSALPFVDRSWISSAYWRGVVIGGINITGPQMADLVGNSCIARDGFAADASIPFFVIVSTYIQGSSQDDINKVLDAYNRSCGEQTTDEVGAFVSFSGSRTTDILIDANSFNTFVFQLVSHLQDIDLARQSGSDSP